MAFVAPQVRPQGEQVDAIAPRKMKLSEAIRIGAKIRPQCMTLFWVNGGSCAMGAALEALGYDPDQPHDFTALFREHFSINSRMAARIFNRNDSGESRESIADWLESQGL